MGICQHKQEQQKNAYSTKALLDHKPFDGLNFYFSTENITRLDAQCLVLFTDKKMKIKKNSALSRISKYQSKKIIDHAQAFVVQNNIQLQGKNFCMIFPISINQLKYSKIALVCLDPWDGKTQIKNDLQDSLNHALQKIEAKEIKSIVITQLDHDMGIPSNIACGALARALFNHRQKFKTITLGCNNGDSLHLSMSSIQYFKQDKTATSFHNDSFKGSIYY